MLNVHGEPMNIMTVPADWQPMTEHEQLLVRMLAPTVLTDRLKRANVVGVTKKGRLKTEMVGEPSEAEVKWTELQARFAR